MSVQPEVSINWEKVYDELIEWFRQYLRINTTNPPGNEMRAADFFRDLCEWENIECKTYESTYARGNILAILRGTGEKKPIVMLNHMDVVPVEESCWNHPPFEAEIHDGYIYNRGAQDMKSFGILEFMAMALLKRTGATLNRDLIFLGTADEEVGGTLGMGYMSEHAPIIKEAEFCINEGGSILETSSGKLVWEVAFSEKVPSRFFVRAKGTPGHGSMPLVDNCNVKLVEALGRINKWRAPFDVLPAVKMELGIMAELEEEPVRSILQNIETAILNPDNVRLLEQKYPQYIAKLRDTHSLTIIHAGSKGNVIPSEGYAQYDARILPGHKRSDFQAQVKELVKDLDVEIEMEDPGRPAPDTVLESVDSEYFKAIKQVAEELTPGAPVIPRLMLGASDSQYFRKMGIPAYGFAPFIFTDKEHHGVHGHNERISLENMKFGIRAFHRILELVAVKK